MIATAPTSTTAPAAVTGPFAERINFNTLYSTLASRGVSLSDEEKAALESITRDELKTHDGGSITGNLFTIPEKLWDMFCVFIQNVTSGKTNGIWNSITTSFANAGEHTKLMELEKATQQIYIRLNQRGGNLAAAAELITGQTTLKSRAEHVEGNVYNQILATLDKSQLPTDLSISLNQKPAVPLASADATPTSGLPASVKPLTNRERGA